MRRSLLTLLVFLVLAAWAGAQTSSPPSPVVQARLFKTNRLLIENLVDRGIGLARTDSPLTRAEEFQKTALAFSSAIKNAAGEQDPDLDRVVELADLLNTVVRDGLVPSLNQAQDKIRPGDPNEEKLKKVRENTTTEIDVLAGTLPSDGKVGDNQKVKDAIAELMTLKSSIKK